MGVCNFVDFVTYYLAKMAHLPVGRLGVDVPEVGAVADEAELIAGPQRLHHRLADPTSDLRDNTSAICR